MTVIVLATIAFLVFAAVVVISLYSAIAVSSKMDDDEKD